MVDILIDDPFRTSIQPTLLEQAALATLELEQAPADTPFTIAIQDDAALKELNTQFRSIDAPTDVLSFPSGEYDPDLNHTYLGDIIISFDRALAQAKSAGHPVSNELQLLVIHGTLHLLGYDHSTTQEKEIMWQIQSRVLEIIGCQINKLPED
jgi:probable rRNA maturation factor